MDSLLAERLNNLNEQNLTLSSARGAYLLKESQKKHFESSLIKIAPGKSHAEKVVNAQATEEWLKFSMELAELEAQYEFEKLRYDILDKAYLAEHLTMKVDSESIKRQGA